MKIKHALDNASLFLIRPSKNPKPCNKNTALAFSIFIGFSTLGTVHLFFTLWMKLRKIPINPKQKKIQTLFKNKVQPSKNQSSPSKYPVINKILQAPIDMQVLPSVIKKPINSPIETPIIKKPILPRIEPISISESNQNDINKPIKSPIDIPVIKKTVLPLIEPVSVSEIDQNDINKPLKSPTDDIPILPLIVNIPNLPQVEPISVSEIEQNEIPITEDDSNNIPKVSEDDSIPEESDDLTTTNQDELSEQQNLLEEENKDVDQQEEPKIVNIPNVEVHFQHEIEVDDQWPNKESRDEPCKFSSPKDWTYFVSILERERMANRLKNPFVVNLDQLGSFLIEIYFFPTIIIKITKQKDDTLSNQPDDLIIQIKIENKEKCTSFKVNDRELLPTNSIPQEHFNILNECYKKVLKIPKMYDIFHARNMGVSVSKRSLLKIPEFHLQKFYEMLRERVKYEMDPGSKKISISMDWLMTLKFHSENFDQENGIGVGLRRQYIEDIFKNLMHSKTLNFFKNPKTGIGLPTSNQQVLLPHERNLYDTLGYLMGYLYQQNSMKSGIYFDRSLFSAILAFNPQEIDQPYSELSQDVRVRIATAMIKSRVADGYQDALKSCIECAELIKKQIEMNQVGEDADAELRKALDQGNIALFESLPEKFADGEVCHFDEIKANKEEFLNALYSTVFCHKDSDYGKIDSQLESIQVLARGMLSAFNEQGIEWKNLQNQGSTELSEKIQGVRDRQKIVDKIIFTNVPNNKEQADYLKTKTQWLKEWILDENTTDKQISDFLKFVTGLTSLSNEDIRITSVAGKSPIPYSHTCSLQLDLCPYPNTLLDSKGEVFRDSEGNTYCDDNKEGFIQILTQYALKESNMIFLMS